jgi:hypothetical protein
MNEDKSWRRSLRLGTTFVLVAIGLYGVVRFWRHDYFIAGVVVDDDGHPIEHGTIIAIAGQTISIVESKGSTELVPIINGRFEYSAHWCSDVFLTTDMPGYQRIRLMFSDYIGYHPHQHIVMHRATGGNGT